MIGITQLYCGGEPQPHGLRYGPARRPGAPIKPVVVWNCTRRCNLLCRHCYSASTTEPDADELTGDEARAMIADLAAFGVPVLLLSGGEPLMRPDVLELIALAGHSGLRVALSTNGTLITPALAADLAEAGVSYVGVSLDGLAEVNDSFRGVSGAFAAALSGIRSCRRAGLKVGLRLTMSRHTVGEIPAIFDLLTEEGIPRVCFYHLVGTGRGRHLPDEGLSRGQTRDALDLIMDRAAKLQEDGNSVEVLTVDNHADGPYVYLRLSREDAAKAERCLAMLRANGGNGSGVAIGCVSWNGDVLPDQFWRQAVLGNVRDKPFSRIWADADGDRSGLLAKLRDRKRHLGGRCARCRWLDVCNGNLRARAEAATGDAWGDDPACYLTDEEIR